MDFLGCLPLVWKLGWILWSDKQLTPPPLNRLKDICENINFPFPSERMLLDVARVNLTWYSTYEVDINVMLHTNFFSFFKIFGVHMSFLWGHWYPCFGLLVMSALGFKNRVHITCPSAEVGCWGSNEWSTIQRTDALPTRPSRWDLHTNLGCFWF